MHRIYLTSVGSNNISYVILPVSNLTIACKSPLNFKYAIARLLAEFTQCLVNSIVFSSAAFKRDSVSFELLAWNVCENKNKELKKNDKGNSNK